MNGMRRTRRTLQMGIVAAVTVPLSLGSGAYAAQSSPTWDEVPTGVDARFRGLDPVSRDIAWVAGSGGTVLRTVDGGSNWNDVSPAGADGLLFRDIEAFGPDEAVALSIGVGENARVYRTTDGGTTWTETFRNDNPAAFYNCVAFFDGQRGLISGDPVDGRFQILSTTDGGASWELLPEESLPEAYDGEYQFAASGQCITTAGDSDAYVATGGAAARVLHSADGGESWTSTTTPMAAAPTRGVYSMAFRASGHGITVGGDYRPDQPSPDALALTPNNGRNWKQPKQAPGEYRSGIAWAPLPGHVAIAVGPSGSDISYDGGKRWTAFGTGSLDTVDCTSDGSCWGAGADGRVTRLLVR